MCVCIHIDTLSGASKLQTSKAVEHKTEKWKGKTEM